MDKIANREGKKLIGTIEKRGWGILNHKRRRKGRVYIFTRKREHGNRLGEGKE